MTVPPPSHPKLKPEQGHSIPLGDVSIMDSEMTPRQIVEVLEQMTYTRGRQSLLIDHGVRTFLLDCLRAKLPRQRGAT